MACGKAEAEAQPVTEPGGRTAAPPELTAKPAVTCSACLNKVRYYGWLHPDARQRFLQVQTLLEVPLDLRTPPPGEGPREAKPFTQPPLHLRCPHCGEFALKRIGRIRRPWMPAPDACVKGSASRGAARARAP